MPSMSSTIAVAIRQGLRVRVVYTNGRGHEAVTPVRQSDKYLVIRRMTQDEERFDTIPFAEIQDVDLLWMVVAS